MLLHITHETRYLYDQPVDYALQKVRLRPLDNPLQNVVDWTVAVEGGKIETSYRDHYGNHTDLVSITPETQNLIIRAQGTVDAVDGAAGVLGPVYGRAPLWHFAQPTPLTVAGDGVKALVRVLETATDLLTGLHDLSAAVLAATPYQTGKTAADTTAEAALGIGAGVCQDHANIFIAAARVAGLPMRYVSGYLMMNDRVDQDASHAWAEAHVPDLGWVGFDVSNGYAPDERYARVAVGRDSADAAPISGMRMGSGAESLIVSLQVQQ